MKNITIILATLTFLISSYKTLNVKDNTINTIVIDAGHGGKDPGCHGRIAKESQVALQVALKTGEMIKKKLPNIKIIYTRDKNEFIELHERAKIANSKGADLFISIHCNANNNSSAYGTEIYAMGLHKEEGNLDVAKRENSVIRQEDNYLDSYDGFDPDSPIAHIMLANTLNQHLEQSLTFASSIDKEFGKFVKKSRGVKQAGFLVLWKTTMPSVLVELGFLTNQPEEKNLTSSAYQLKMANSISDAFVAYKKGIENN